eukprot:1150926-Pelagomonas_calceolata.AAC.5
MVYAWLPKIGIPCCHVQKDLVVFAKKVKQPRLVAYYATDIERGSFTYSGRCMPKKTLLATCSAPLTHVHQKAGGGANSLASYDVKMRLLLLRM